MSTNNSKANFHVVELPTLSPSFTVDDLENREEELIAAGYDRCRHDGWPCSSHSGRWVKAVNRKARRMHARAGL